MPSRSSLVVQRRRPDPASAPGPSLRQLSRPTICAADADRVLLVRGEVVGQAGLPGVHLGAAERLVVGLLAGRHLHQRRPGQEHLGALLDHHDVVAHAGHVGAAGGGVAEDERDRRDARRRQPGEVAEHLPARDEDLLLGRQVRAAGLDQADRPAAGSRSAISLARSTFFSVHGLDAPPRTVGSLPLITHSTPFDDADAGDHARADGEVGAPGGQRRELEERRARVEQQLDALAGQQLAARVVPVDVLLAAAGDRLGVLGVEVGESVEQRRAVGARTPRRQRAHRSPFATTCASRQPMAGS